MSQRQEAVGMNAQLAMQREFLKIVERCQERGGQLDLDQVRAMCLSMLSEAGGGAIGVLWWRSAVQEDLEVVLVSGSLPEDLVPPSIPLDAKTAERLLHHPQQFQALEPLKVLDERLGAVQRGFGRALVEGNRVLGALLLVPPGQKTFDDEERRMLEAMALQTETLFQSARAMGQLIESAVVDHLTGMYNNRYFRERLRTEVARAARHGRRISLLFCGIDAYKALVLEHGHVMGYQVVREVARVFAHQGEAGREGFSFRSSDIPVYYGDGEFVVILPETDKPGALTKAERLCRHVAGRIFENLGTLPAGEITVSVGVAAFPEDGVDEAALLESADRALARARDGGADQVVGA